MCQSSRVNISLGNLDTRESLYRFALRGGIAERRCRLRSYCSCAVLLAALQPLAQDPAQVFIVIAKKTTLHVCIRHHEQAPIYSAINISIFPSSSATLLIFPALSSY